MKIQRAASASSPRLAAPFLRRIQTIEERINRDQFPFTLPLFSNGIDLALTTRVTFLVGENGSGKSTLLEAIAGKCGFNLEGGNRDHAFANAEGNGSALGDSLRLSWLPKVTEGFFLRAESFFNVATYLDSYGDTRFHQQSHGESFLSLFMSRFKQGLFLLDEPEAAFSPQRQLAFLTILKDLETAGASQFIIATHSPMLLAFPGATVLSLDRGAIRPVDYRETEHFQVMKSFLDNPERYFQRLFAEDNEA